MKSVSVLLCREPAGRTQIVWVAQCLDEDMATQGSPEDSALSVVEMLGNMFDHRDRLNALDLKGSHCAALDPAPSEYTDEYNAGLLLGELPLGIARVATVRIGKSPFVVGAFKIRSRSIDGG